MTDAEALEDVKKRLAMCELDRENWIDLVRYLRELMKGYRLCIYMLVALNIATVVFLMIRIHKLQGAM